MSLGFVRAARVLRRGAGSNSSFLQVDYSIDPELTQYVLSVALDRGGVIRSVKMES